ncbi:MAG: methyl-accepting chemotaxis protein [Oscillospiraceae bacterium]
MELLNENERSANKASAKVMRITALVFALVLILDIVGIFKVPLGVMIAAYLMSTALLFVPTFLVNFAKRDGSWVKYVIVLCAILFTVLVAATLSYHAVLLFVYPIAIASLYFSKSLNRFATVLTVIGVSAGQVASFYLRYVTDDNQEDLKRVLLFGVLPRAMILLAISAIFTMLCKRTTSMLGSLMGAEQQRIMREKSLEVSEKLLTTVSELDRISSAAAEANTSIADDSERVMRDSDANFEYIKGVEESMTQISESLNRLSEMSSEIARLTKRADDITADNNDKMTQASESMEQIFTGTNESKEIILQLSDRSQRIVKIAKVITDISMQTNILAINASIEASRAGEAGKGFSVVASEIKKLSEQTKHAATEIGGIISEVTENINNTVSAMEKNVQLTREGMESMEQVKASTEQISASTVEISKHISDMNGVIGAVAVNGSSVSEKLANVSVNIENNCGAVQHVAAAIEENSAGTQSLGFMVKDIKIMAEELEKLTS